MPFRRPPPAVEEEKPFVPSEPWWRKSSPRNGLQGKAEPKRFETVTPRISDREPPRLLPPIRIPGRVMAATLALVIILGGVGLILTSDLFTVTRSDTEIRGAQRIPEDTIFAASQIDGMNIFQIQSEQAVTRIRQIEGVADTAIHLRLPNQAIIDVREYVPAVAWQTITTTLWVADSGAVLPVSGDPPAVTLVDAQGAARDAQGRLRPDVLANIETLRQLDPEITQLYYGALEGLYFRSAEGWTVYLGNDGKMATKLATLRELRQSNVSKNMRNRIVDLRFDGRVQLR